ncbi:copper-binding protein [Rhizobium sp. 57MFTsu3.2]|uniref:copper-binding protein n=1 Tax=Rhizobium sp. 57MFTsu3.2 TaxID=1048681 RepID=UPI00146DA3CE|nr:copper-binding protein [Rhizobium sp. 57MFTsu3.2]NMN69471.1 Cu/Ag efflux protein CusF [Rhizobium sp. 57MFTsu3.2]
MKTVINLVAALAISLAGAGAALAQEFTKGVVNKVDAKGQKVTIKHDDLKNLDMPAMTMVFRVKEAAILEKLKAGQNIEFVAERVDGKLTVTQVK